MKKIKIIALFNLLILFAWTVSAFGEEAVKPVPPVLPSSPVTGVPLAPAPAMAPVSETPDNVYSYNPMGKPDPFKPFINTDLSALKTLKEKKVESIFPLERAEIESFKLVGIAGDQMRRVAIVEDVAKKFYPLFIGTRIGLHNGKVIDILADRVAVDEPDGKKVKRIIMKLRKNI